MSLLPSGTEILGLIEADHYLVGRSHECDYPADLGALPVLTSARAGSSPGQPLEGDLAAGAIDERVRAMSSAGQALYTLDEALLAELKPDLIITQDLCSVCSIDLNTVRSVADRLENPPEIVCLNPMTLEDVLDDILRVGRATGLDRRAMHAVVGLRERADRALEHVNPYAEGPVVGFMEWTDPVYIAGHWSVQIIERAGGRHPLNETVAKPGSGAAVGPQQAERVAGASIAVSGKVFASVRPERVVIAPCGLSLDQTRQEHERLLAQDWYRDLPAVQAGRVALVDGNQMFNRPGPRLYDALEFMVGWLNDRPDLIPHDFPWELPV